MKEGQIVTTQGFGDWRDNLKVVILCIEGVTAIVDCPEWRANVSIARLKPSKGKQK